MTVRLPCGAGERAGDRRALDAPDAAHAQRGCGKDGAGRACGEEAVGLALADGRAAAHDGGVLLGAHGIGGMLVHGNGLGAHQRLCALVLGTEGNDQILGTRHEHAEVAVGLERIGDAVEHDLGLPVAAHDIDADGDHMPSSYEGRPPHGAGAYEKEADPGRDRPPWLSYRTKRYSVTTTSRSL